MILALAILGALVAGFIYASMFEWTLHKYVMHHPFFGLRYAFKAHALTHHRVFSWDETYVIARKEDEPLVTFAWWNMPVLMALNAPVFIGGGWLAAGFAVTPVFWGAAAGAAGAMLVYYFLYEYLHWCMHVPTGRWFERSRWFRFIDDHHRMHHRRPTKNLNVVMPLADWILRTKAPGLAPVSRIAAEALEAR